MTSTFRKRAERRIVRAFCILLVVGGVAPLPAQASCGNDVDSNAIRSTGESLFDFELLAFSAEQGDAAPPVLPNRGMPCTGATCSRGRGLPPAPATFVSARISDICCSTTVANCWGNAESAAELTDLDKSHPLHNTFPPERPPRNPRPRAH
jgi:hypothetical protein